MIFLLDQELALHRGLGNYLLFAPRDSLIASNRIISLPSKKNRKANISNPQVIFFTRLSRYPASGALCRHHHYITFSIFFRRRQKMLINKRRNSDPAAAGGNNAKLDITDREKSYGTLFICYYIVELFEFVRFLR